MSKTHGSRSNSANQYLNALLLIWLILWVIALLTLPRDYYTPLFFIIGAAPVVLWFLIKPRRIIWFVVTLLGIREPNN